MASIFRMLQPATVLRMLREHVEYFRQRRTFAWIRSIQSPAGAKRHTVLFVNFGNWIPRAIMDGVIAAALRMRGYTPIVLTLRACARTHRTLRILGVTECIFLDDFFSIDMKTIEMESARILQKYSTFDSLFAYKRDDIEHGRNVLSTVVRDMKSGGVSFHDPQAQTLLRKLMPYSLCAGHAAQQIFAKEHPVAVLFMEKGYTPYAEMADVAIARGCNVIQYHHAQRSDLMLLKRFTPETKHHHSSSLSKDSWEKVKAMPWSASIETDLMDELKRGYEQGTWMNRKFLLRGKKLKSPEEVRQQLGLDPKNKTAVIFSHVLWDATFFFGKNLFPDYEHWLVETVRVACSNTNVNWVIKLHPDYIWKVAQMGSHAGPRDTSAIHEALGELPSHIKIVLPDTDISTYSFFAVTDYCITVRGTIGIEAPCFGIPTFTAGTGRYSGLGFTEDSATVDEYLGKMARIQEFPKMSVDKTSLARRHAYALFRLRPFSFTSCEIAPKPQSDGKLEQEAIVRVFTPSDIRDAKDLHLMTEWILNNHDEDYLGI